MLDGKGNFLPESKRGLPTPTVAFTKSSGSSALFKRSKRFGRYHLTYLGKDQNHEIEILSGAFMLMRKSALEQSGPGRMKIISCTAKTSTSRTAF